MNLTKSKIIIFVFKTCENIWNFKYSLIVGKNQIRIYTNVRRFFPVPVSLLVKLYFIILETELFHATTTCIIILFVVFNFFFIRPKKCSDKTFTVSKLRSIYYAWQSPHEYVYNFLKSYDNINMLKTPPKCSKFSTVVLSCIILMVEKWRVYRIRSYFIFCAQNSRMKSAIVL